MPRLGLPTVLAIAALLVVLRTIPFVVPGVRFDADQAVVGLAAKHIAEGRAYPVFFYGQSYLPALESYLAAPVMAVMGFTETALKLPVLGMNVAAGLLVVWSLARDGGLGPWLGLLAALPLLLPAAVISTRVMEAMGGNVESFLYVPLLWLVRDRPWTFAVLLGASAAQREFAYYGAAALVGLELLRGRLFRMDAVRRWAIAATGVVAARTLLEALRPFAAMFGPGSLARDVDTDIEFADLVGSQVCLDPARWPSRLDDLLQQHLPMAFGGHVSPLADFAVNTTVPQGSPYLHAWVGAFTGVALVAAAVGAVRGREPAPADSPAVPGRDVGAYYVLVGLVSLAVYWLVACSRIGIESLRYDLLVILVPVGALALAMRHVRSVPLTAGLAAAAGLASLLNLADLLALGAEVRAGGRPDYRREAAAALDGRGVRSLWGEFRIAYPVAFYTEERVRPAATGFHKIDAYAEEAKTSPGQVLQTQPCRTPGHLVAPTIYLCPPER